MKAGSKNALALALDDAELQLRQELADKISQMKKAQRCHCRGGRCGATREL